MKRNRIVVSVLLALFLLLIFGWSWSAAQIQEGWTVPIRLSTGNGSASEASLVQDSYGYVHAFWPETQTGGSSLIMYSRYDGRNWSTPVDVVSGEKLGIVQGITAAISPDNTIYLMWSAGPTGPLFMVSAPAHEAHSARNWSEALRIPGPAGFITLQVDADNVLHLLYSVLIGQDTGLYYTRSTDQGISWSPPRWMDPDIPPGLQPAWVQFQIDEHGGLHASWFYLSLTSNDGDWVRYTHSMDGGDTWMEPITIDRLDEREIADGMILNHAYPNLIIVGDNVHIVWAGGLFHYRHHRYSTDRGVTWSEPTDLFGELNGQAGDGVAVDGNGRIHLFTQIRFPQAIYHSVWDGQSWSAPTIVYLIRLSGDDPMGDRIHAHRTFPIISRGKEILLTFTDPPPEDGRRLFVTSHILDDVTAATVQPTPTAEPAAEVEATATPPATVAAPITGFDSPAPPSQLPRVDQAIWIGLAPVMFLAVLVILYRLFSRRSG